LSNVDALYKLNLTLDIAMIAYAYKAAKCLFWKYWKKNLAVNCKAVT